MSKDCMNRLILTCASLITVSSAASAQTTGSGYQDALTPSLAAVAKTMQATIRRELAESAERMPAREYAFRPTSKIRSFAQLMGHVINANWFFCSQARVEAPPNTRNHEELTDKAVLVKALNDSLEYCDRAYEDTTDTNVGQPVPMRPPLPGAQALGPFAKPSCLNQKSSPPALTV